MTGRKELSCSSQVPPPTHTGGSLIKSPLAKLSLFQLKVLKFGVCLVCRAPQRPEEGTGILEPELQVAVYPNMGAQDHKICQPPAPLHPQDFPSLSSGAPPLPFFYTGSTIPYTCLPSFPSQLAFGFSQLPGLAPTGMQRVLLPPLQSKASPSLLDYHLSLASTCYTGVCCLAVSTTMAYCIEQYG